MRLMTVPSLRWRLIVSLILLQLAVSVVVLCGFIVLGWVMDRGDESGQLAVTSVQHAIHRDARGRLSLDATADIAQLRKEATWFVALDEDGTSIQEGDVPQHFLEMARSMRGITRIGIEPNADNSQPQARYEQVETRAGRIAVLVQTGGPVPIMKRWERIGVVLLWVVTPMALVTCLGVIIATPFVVKRALREVVAAADHAESIDVHKHTTPLPLADVAEEIRPLVNAVNRAFDRLNKDYERQERFLADAAHELRTPITTLQLRIEGLPNDLLKAKLMHASARLSTMAAQLLDLQRLERIAANHAPVDLKALCERVTADVAPLAIMNRCTLSVEAPHALMAMGDAPSLERALTNLIQNAIDHGGAGCEIVVRLWLPSGFEVIDSGPGIPAAERERVVEPFHRLVPRGRGAGLGLHLVAEVARLHNGQLIIDSSELGGAKMRLALNTGI